jgi:iron complex outermembrane receptor protein
MLKQIAGLAMVVSALAPGLSWGQTQLPDLAGATLEELMNIEVTSVSRREQRQEDVAASLYVIGRDEIRRSGLTTIAEVLRLAPGVQVSRVNSNKWSVSVRGFNTVASSKLLVMVDGRSIYSPAHATVLWDTEDVMLEDVERIEVIRGPGGAMWGANAVTGVINIITRPSAETRGGLARVSGGTFDTSSAAFRYGGGKGALSYRVFAQGSDHGQSRGAFGGPAHDAWQSVTGGFRADWSGGPQTVMFQAATTVGEQRPLWIDPRIQPQPAPTTGVWEVSNTRVSHAQMRWTRARTNGDTLQVQGYFDENKRDEFLGFYHRRTYDADAQYTSDLGRGHTLVTGGGYRHLTEQIRGREVYSFTPEQVRPIIANAFGQDTVAVAGDRAEVTFGAKYEHSTFTGAAFQPNARVMWKPARQQRVWAAVARAVRTPSLVNRGVRIELPPVPLPNGMSLVAGAVGNPDLTDESVVSIESGYRVSVGGRLSVDAVGFRGSYSDLISQEPPAQPTFAIVNGVPTLFALATFENRTRATTTGAEFTARTEVVRGWDVDASLSFFHVRTFANGSQDTHTVTVDGDTPSRQWRLHSGWSLGPRRLADVRLMRVGALRAAGVAAYTRLDARLEWGLSGHVSIAADGQNLLSRSHLESALISDALGTTRIPRSGNLGLVWRF